jgi:hypothetical protein
LNRPRQTQSTLRDMENIASELITALRASGDPVQVDLASHLWRCQQGREDRRKGVPFDWPPMCRSPACPSCRRWLSKSWRDRAAERMACADNNACHLITVMLARSGSLDAVRTLTRQLRTELRNLRDRNARTDLGWRSVEMVGQVEVDAFGPEDICLLPPQRRTVIEALPAFGGSCGYATYNQIVVWVSHIHIACHAPHLSAGELHGAFARQWPGDPRRVDVRPFREGEAGANAGAIIGYASKHEMRFALKDGFDLCWPIAVQAAYWGWLHGLRNGLAPLRLRVGAMGERKSSASYPATQSRMSETITVET